ncbi:DUF192 domain-containing protein [Sulfitobacter sp. 1151]|uniref:DUF192 domain-containing protein n=1 Tax=Parasulfitobacter algicola TaxID=2614809 RepID=A0ABX2IXA4_9RHOB|nr:DUF192 domain-containing protein [Sulfitobacter algicola]
MFLPFGAFADCSPDFVDIKGDWGQARFQVEIADDAAERGQGLMHRETMPRFSGMLFVYPDPQELAFWMQNTLIPLDMIFMAPDGQVLKVHENAIPHDRTPIPSGPGVSLVLEINGGMAKSLGIAAGSVMRHPILNQSNALWPC